MSGCKTLSRYLIGVLGLLCLTGVGQVWAVDTITNHWAFSQEIGLDPSGGGSIRQAIGGWGLVEVGQTDSVSTMNSFQNVKGTMASTQVTGNLNNVASMVFVGPATQSPLTINSAIADNVLLNYSSTYSTVIGGGSFSSSRGIVAVSQVAGNMNNIANIVGLSTQGAPGLALSNATLGNVSASNNVYKNLGVTQASAEIQSDSFKGFSGVGSVVQASGNMIQISSRVSVKVNQ